MWELKGTDGPFTVARFFSLHSNAYDDKCHLLIATALELAIVFWYIDTMEQGFSRK